LCLPAFNPDNHVNPVSIFWSGRKVPLRLRVPFLMLDLFSRFVGERRLTSGMVATGRHGKRFFTMSWTG
jgi:hypothetical protein